MPPKKCYPPKVRKIKKVKKDYDDEKSLSDIEGEGFKDFFQAAKRVAK